MRKSINAIEHTHTLGADDAEDVPNCNSGLRLAKRRQQQQQHQLLDSAAVGCSDKFLF